jgi:sugar phosphate isomerase/epimerase
LNKNTITRLSRRDALTLLAATASAGPVLAQTAPAAPRKLKLGMASRHLQFMIDIDEAVAFAREAGFEAIEWGVRAGAHIEPARVKQDLPTVVEKTRKAGVAVEMIITGIQDDQTPYAEDILSTAQSLGIRHYRNSAYYRYDYAKPLISQIEALTPRLASLIALNQRYNTVLCYHTHSAPGMIGGNVWDIWTALRSLDPATLGLNYDSAHTSIRNGAAGWRDAALVASPYVKALGLKDFRWVKNASGRTVSEFCPMGEGDVDFDQFFGFFRDMQFNGPVNIHFEHSNLLGTDVGKWFPAMSKAEILGIFQRDVAFARSKMQTAGFA